MYKRQVLTLGKTHIVTNGDQTDTIYDLMSQGKSFADALRTRTFEPVSYTHLDVYKRQDHQTVGTLQHIHRLADGGLDAAHAQAVAGDQVADHLGIGAVSYTHLSTIR